LPIRRGNLRFPDRVGVFTLARDALAASAAPLKPDDLLHRNELTLRVIRRRAASRVDRVQHSSFQGGHHMLSSLL